MFLTDRLGSRVHFDSRSLLARATASSRGRIGNIIAIATIVGLASVVALTPITGRGDYGQWLMTSRFYLGESVPSYRDIPALPALVPILLAGMQIFLRTPELVLQFANLFTLAGLGVAFYLGGRVISGTRLTGALALAVALLVTDRFLELLAFGGLLQGAALVFLTLGVVSLVHAGRTRMQRWWVVGALCLGALALSHVGTAMIGVPIGLVVAGMAAFPMRRAGWRPVLWRVAPLLVVLGMAAIYWLLILAPASAEYIRNPASLAYRGPDRLIAALFSYWPTGLLVVLGVVGTAVMLGEDVRARRLGGGSVVGAWLLVAWGALAVSAVTGAATDYPRFATILLVPLVLATADVSIRSARLVSGSISSSDGSVGVASTSFVLAVIIVAAPFAVNRFARQANVYQPRDAASLSSAVEALAGALPADATVLTSVRDGKWLEGTTGHEALFSLPVRYAFRPVEWQRSVDADVLLRSYGAISNGYFLAELTGRSGSDATVTPGDLLLAVNHGGEFVDLLQASRADVALDSGEGVTAASRLTPGGSDSTAGTSQVSVTSRWHADDGSGVSLAETMRAWQGGTTFDLVDQATNASVSRTLRAAAGTAFTTVAVSEREARVCFAATGEAPPCLRIWAAQPDAAFTSTPNSLTVRTSSQRLELHVTALTAAEPSVGLAYLDPANLVIQHHIGAALFYNPDPSTEGRMQRLRSLGFTRELRLGSYVALIRAPAP
jgi:hypothetical protein